MADHVAQWEGVERMDIPGIPDGLGFKRPMLRNDDTEYCYLIAVKPENWSAIAHVPMFEKEEQDHQVQRLLAFYEKLPDKEGTHACPEGQCTAEPITPDGDETTQYS